MNQPLWVRAYRIAFGLLGLVAVVRKYDVDGDTVANWLSKFTIEGNTLAALALLGGGVLSASVLTSPAWERLRGAVVMYMVMTFIVYGVLINGFDNPFTTSRHWTHTVLHQLMPLVIVLDLIIRPLAHRLTWRDALLWTIYPIVYLAYSLARGAIVDWYPYNFLNPHKVGGYDGVALYSLGISTGFLALAFLIVWLNNLRQDRRRDKLPTQPTPPTVHDGRISVPHG